jgi:3-oxoadipate enol-lactonase
MPKALVNGISLHYRVSGRGEPLVLLAGWGTSLRAWMFQLPAFSAHFRVLSFDNRGAGRSDKPPGPYTIRLLADDAVALMDHLHLKAANVLGISMGGMIAQEVAINYPTRVLKLVLGSTFAFQGEDSGPTDDYARRASQDARQVRLILASLASNNFLVRHAAGMVVRVSSHFGMDGFRAQGAAIREHDTRSRLHLIKCPTLVIVGTNDRVIRPSSSTYIASKVPNGTLVVIENGSHSIGSESRKRFNKAVLKFLNGSKGREAES